MQNVDMSPILTSDHFIQSGQGVIFARRWVPVREESAGGETLTPLPAPLILFHESTGSVAQWRDFPALLAQTTGRTVIAYDRLGFGQSDAHPRRLTRDFMGDEARDFLPALLAHFGVGAFVALGHSVGGEIAVATAAAMPERVAAVITISAQSFVEQATLEGVRAAKIAFAAPDRFARVERHHGAKARWVLDAWFDTWLDPDFADWSLDADLARLVCPVMAIHGSDDEFGTAAHPRRITSVPTSPTRLEYLEGIGHIPYREDPARIAALIKDFLDSVTAPKGSAQP